MGVDPVLVFLGFTWPYPSHWLPLSSGLHFKGWREVQILLVLDKPHQCMLKGKGSLKFLYEAL